MTSSQQDSELRRLQKFKQTERAPALAIGNEMVAFFKHSIQRRQTKLADIARAWETLVPATLIEHTSLESFSVGSLTVLVDSSSHLYEMKQLLLSGLQQQILLACRKSGLKKINLKPGRWYEGDSPGERKIRFE